MHSMIKFREDIEKLFGDFWAYGPLEPLPEYVIVSGDNYPRCNLQTYLDNGKKCAFVELAVPGLTKDELEISLSGGVLSIKGKKRVLSELNEKQYKLRELHNSSFYREFNLNNLFEVDEDSVTTSLVNGILTVCIKSRHEEKPTKRLIKIE